MNGVPLIGKAPAWIDALLSEPYNRWELANGVTVLHQQEAGCGLLSVQACVRTGSIHEGRHLGSGLSHYLEHLVFRGTAKRALGEISREVQSAGASINAYTTFDRTVYYIDGPHDCLDHFLDLLADMLYNPTLSEESITVERAVIQREIDMGMDDPERLLAQGLFRTVFTRHPYRFPVIGYRELFDALTGDDIREYHAARYVPNNTVVCIVGDCSREEVEAALAPTFAQPPRSPSPPVLVQPEDPQLAPRDLRLHADVQVCRGTRAYRVPGLAHLDAPGLEVLANALGGGLSSLLWQQLREEQGIAHSIGASVWNPGQMGLFWISYVCPSGQGEAVEAGIDQVLEECSQGGFLAGEVAKLRQQAMVAEVNTRQTVAGRATRLLLAEVVIGDLNYPKRFFERLTEVDEDSLRRLLTTYLRVDQRTDGSLDRPPPEAPAVIRSEEMREVRTGFAVKTLENGASLVWQRDTRLPKLHLRLSGLGGAAFEEPNRRGATALLTTMLTKDSRWRSYADVAAKAEKLGASLGGDAGNNSWTLWLDLLAEDFDEAWPLLEEAALEPAFLEETFARERLAQIAEIREEEDEISDFARKALRRRFFGAHPLATEALGEIDHLDNMSIRDLRALHDRLFVAPNMVLTVCGAFDPDVLLPRLETLLWAMPQWGFWPTSKPFQRSISRGIEQISLPREQAVVGWGFHDCGIAASEQFAGELLTEIANDMSGRLLHEVREERGLAYWTGASRILTPDCGMFALAAGTAPERAEEVAQMLEKEACLWAEGDFVEGSLARARKRLVVAKRTRHQRLASRAGEASLNVLYGLPVNEAENYAARLEAVKRADLAAFAQDVMRIEDGVGVIISPS